MQPNRYCTRLLWAALESWAVPNGSQSWFFVTGCQRSGTTLLRLILECHPDVLCFDELDSYRVLSLGCAEEADGKPFVGFKVPRWAEQLDAHLLWDYGLPETARDIYHGQKIIFMVRDYRDAISSMLKLRAAKTWLEEWAEPIVRAKANAEPYFRSRWARELKLCQDAPDSLACLGAFYWKYKNDALLKYKAKGYPILAVSYEKLTLNAEAEIKRICSFLGIGFSRELLDHPAHSHRELFSNGLTLGSTDPRRAIDTKSIGQWPSFLDARDIQLANDIVGDLPGLLHPFCDI